MGLPDATRQPKGEHIGRVIQEIPFRELMQFAGERRRQPPFVERVERLARRQL